jgi:hypothetical protein
MSEITFKKVQTEKSVDRLFEMKNDLVKQASDLHVELHSGNSNRDKSEILGDINETRDLEDYVIERIKNQKRQDYIDQKEARHGLREFKEICRKRLPEELFTEIDRESKKVSS